jgi:hypothetical protein
MAPDAVQRSGVVVGAIRLQPVGALDGDILKRPIWAVSAAIIFHRNRF